RLPDRFVRYGYIRDTVAPAVRLSADVIEAELDAATAAAEPGRRRSRPVAPPTPPPAPGDVAGARPRDPQLQLERELLQVALQTPDLLPEAWQKITVDDFRAPMSRVLFTALRAAPA